MQTDPNTDVRTDAQLQEARIVERLTAPVVGESGRTLAVPAGGVNTGPSSRVDGDGRSLSLFLIDFDPLDSTNTFLGDDIYDPTLDPYTVPNGTDMTPYIGTYDPLTDPNVIHV